MSDVECPYCGSECELDHGEGISEDETYHHQCIHCDKTFTYTATFVTYFTANKADCLNGGKHRWKPTITVPKQYTKMCCSDCNEYRNPTPEERSKYEIPDI